MLSRAHNGLVFDTSITLCVDCNFVTIIAYRRMKGVTFLSQGHPRFSWDLCCYFKVEKGDCFEASSKTKKSWDLSCASRQNSSESSFLVRLREQLFFHFSEQFESTISLHKLKSLCQIVVLHFHKEHNLVSSSNSVIVITLWSDTANNLLSHSRLRVTQDTCGKSDYLEYFF